MNLSGHSDIARRRYGQVASWRGPSPYDQLPASPV